MGTEPTAVPDDLVAGESVNHSAIRVEADGARQKRGFTLHWLYFGLKLISFGYFPSLWAHLVKDEIIEKLSGSLLSDFFISKIRLFLLYAA